MKCCLVGQKNEKSLLPLSKKHFYKIANTCWQVSYAEQNSVQMLTILANSIFLKISKGVLNFFLNLAFLLGRMSSV